MSNHARVLTLVAADPDVRVRDIASQVGITERAVQEILRQLIDAGFLVVAKRGRRNHYAVVSERPLRHPMSRARPVGELIAALGAGDPGDPRPVGAPASAS